MILRPFLNDRSSCASYLFGCLTHAQLAVVDPHVDFVDAYLDAAAVIGAPITAVFETHVQADHVSGLPALVERTSARAFLPVGAGVDFEHDALGDGDQVEMGNTIVRALSTPGHAPAHHAYLVSDLRRGTREPWLAFTGDSLLIGDVGRPDLHVVGDPAGQARLLHGSLARLLELADGVVVLPSHYAGSVCGRALSANPFSSIGFERTQNTMLAYSDADEFAVALLKDTPPRPPEQEAIVAQNRRGASSLSTVSATPTLGLRANAAQFSLLVALNALVGGMVGLERSVLPLVGERDFKLSSTAAILAFVVAFGLAKAITNLAAGALADHVGRKRLLVLGWLVALPVPLLVGLAPVVELHRRRQHPARHQSGPRLVNDRGDEDRSRRARPSWSGTRPQRGRRLSGRRHYGACNRRARRDLRAAHRGLGRRGTHRGNRHSSSQSSSCGTPPRTSQSNNAHIQEARSLSLGSPRLSGSRHSNNPCCAPATRPGWSTT